MTGILLCNRTGSKPNLALVKLYALAGIATALEWRQALNWREPASNFDKAIIIPLVQFGLIFRRRENWHISDAGCIAIGIDPNISRATPEAAAPATPPAPVQVQLPRGRLFDAVPIRTGALDYRDIPSRHGDQLIPYRKA